jgi:hypothetical protein
VPVCLFDETVTTCFPYFAVRQHSNENLSGESDLHIDTLTQEVPQLPSRYSPGLLARHVEQLLPRLAIIVWEGKIIVSI